MINKNTDLEESGGSILPSQYSGLYRRRGFNGEYRLLWAVLEQAVRKYLAITARSTAEQQTDFEEVRNWFHAGGERLQALFSFQSICDLLEIDPGLLLRRIESIRAKDLPKRRYRGTGRANRIKPLAA